MKKYKYSDLLLYKGRIEKFYTKLGLKFDTSSRISQYFKYLNEIEKKRTLNQESFSQMIKKDKAKFYLSQFYVLEIYHIIDAIQNSNYDPIIIKGKLKRLMEGSYLLSEEIGENTVARNTAFELSLFSFFKQKGLNCRLEEPNPDIRLFTSRFTYNIECKRPFSINNLEKNIKKALRQLRKSVDGKSIPTIALSLDQVLLKELLKEGDPILDSQNYSTALNFLDSTLYKFLQENLSMISKICGKEPCIILYYLACLVGFKTDLPMARAMYMIGNVYNFDENLSKSLYDDLKVLASKTGENS